MVAAAAAAAALAGVAIYRSNRPQVHVPGTEFEEITRKLALDLPEEAPLPRFTDVTAAAGLGDFRSFAGERTSQLPEDMGSGAAWGDFDNDGDDDLFLVSAGGALSLPPAERAPSELYENLGDGTFRKVESFPNLHLIGMAAAWGDYDGDGWLDLVVTGYGSLLLLRNDEGRFVRETALPEPPGYWAGATWGDFDNDRDLDLYVCGYVRYAEAEGALSVTQQYGAAVPYTLNPASYEPEKNLLFRNDGGVFTEIAQLWGVSNPGGRSLTALWRDFDDDGHLDLYVANDISDNALYLNREETFEDVSLAAWVADYRGAMGLAAGDWNRDGDDDLFVTHWVAQENALYDSRWKDSQPAPRLTFSDLAAPLGLGQMALPFVGWGTEFADFDGDGWLDLMVANGSTFETEETPKRLKPQAAFLLWNRRGESFHDLAPLNEVLAEPGVGRGLAVSDYDLDGDLDVVVVRHDAGVQLLRNDMQTGHWLQLVLRSGDEHRAFGDGATVRVRFAGVEQRRSLTSASYLSQSSRRVHFGLGEAEGVEELEVRWLGGGVDTYRDLTAGAVWELREGDPVARRISSEAPADERERVVEFWSKHRAAMDAMKRDGDIPRARELFRQALELDPDHEDARYYLANCLAAEGRLDEAMTELRTLIELNAQSHRGLKRWGTLRAKTASSPAQLAAAEEALERALEINPEAAGSLQILGEIALKRGAFELADQRFEWVGRTNPRAVGALFLRGFLAWKAGDEEASRGFLGAAREARGEDWKPEGAVAEGDVATLMHRDETLLADFWERWDGSLDLSAAFRPLEDSLSASR